MHLRHERGCIPFLTYRTEVPDWQGNSYLPNNSRRCPIMTFITRDFRQSRQFRAHEPADPVRSTRAADTRNVAFPILLAWFEAQLPAIIGVRETQQK